jgi:hypothetical protein
MVRTKTKRTKRDLRNGMLPIVCRNDLNRLRADQARVALYGFIKATDADYETSIGDLINNLLHLVRRDRGESFDISAFVST